MYTVIIMRKIKAKIQKWGNGLGLRVSGLLRDIPHFTVDTPVEIEVTDNGFTVTKIKAINKTTLPFSEKDLLKNLTPENAHADILSKPLKSEF